MGHRQSRCAPKARQGGLGQHWRCIQAHVLDKLPRDVLRDNVWLHLHESDEDQPRPNVTLPLLTPETRNKAVGCSFRLACHRTHGLADQLVRRVGLGQTNLAATLAQQAAFLTRQESLDLLALDGSAAQCTTPAPGPMPPCEDYISALLSQGGAACQRLPALDLRSFRCCSAAAGAAARRCCPNLRSLHLEAHPMEPTFFTPWNNSLHLTRVNILDTRGRGNMHSGPVIPVLAQLPALHSLILGGALYFSDFTLLTQLSRLSELSIGEVLFNKLGLASPAAAHVLGTTLGRLTQLTALALPLWRSDHHPLTPGSQEERCAIMDALVAPLSRLPRLHSLALPEVSGAVVHDSHLTLRRLTALTQLSCGALSKLLRTGDCHLPHLQQLRLTTMVGPEDLLATLRPLLPLPQLRCVRLFISFEEDGMLRSTDMGTTGAVSSAAASEAARLLAAAPHLNDVDVQLWGTGRRSPAERAAAAQAFLPAPLLWDPVTLRGPVASDAAVICIVPALLQPLSERLVTLRLDHLPAQALEQVWLVLRLATSLQRLDIGYCEVQGNSLLMALEQHLHALQRLHVCWCPGLPAAFLLGLAHVRMRPLEAHWLPWLDVAERKMFRSVARPGVTVHRYC